MNKERCCLALYFFFLPLAQHCVLSSLPSPLSCGMGSDQHLSLLSLNAENTFFPASQISIQNGQYQGSPFRLPLEVSATGKQTLLALPCFFLRVQQLSCLGVGGCYANCPLLSHPLHTDTA